MEEAIASQDLGAMLDGWGAQRKKQEDPELKQSHSSLEYNGNQF